MSFKIESLRGADSSPLSMEGKVSPENFLLTDLSIREEIKGKSGEALLRLQELFTQSPERVDSSRLSPEVGLEWLGALPGSCLSVDGEAFPFPNTIDCSKGELESYLGTKTGFDLQWVTPSDRTLEGLFALVREGKFTHLKLQGGFALSERQFEKLLETLSNTPHLVSLELSNIRLNAEQVIEISKVVKESKSLIKLTLESNGIGAKVVPDFLEMIRGNPNLKEVKLTLNLFETIPGLSDLAKAGKKDQMIDLSSNWDFC
ncbi:MAG: hypothetical protein KFB95_02230 [Simkaniaceae bacterium]|nr:MAG: hypothetical protein KFB95_02230 [Simkaniaceae bacterium]